MLNEYLPNELLKEEFVKRDYVLSTIEKYNSWKGGNLVVPFKAAGASSVAFGSLSASNDIAEDKYVRGVVSGHKEVWGSMIFNERDLMEHDMISEQNFLKILPDTIDDFLMHMKNVVSINLLNGSHYAKATTDGTVGAGIEVDRPDRLVIGQKISVDDDNSAPVTGYVKTIDMNTRMVVLEDARGSGVIVDLSAYTVAQKAKLYNDGQQANGFTSLKASLLSAANGGSSSLYGVTKASFPYLQAINEDGSGVNATNILEKIFDALVSIRQKGKGAPAEILMSFRNFGWCMKLVEASKGAFNVLPQTGKAPQYGWMDITIASPSKGAIKLVAVQEADDDAIMFLDWRAMKFYSNGFFRRRKAPDGKEFFEIRNTTGFQYIVDVCLFGELVLQRPSYCGILHSIA